MELLDRDMRSSKSIAKFKSKLLSKIRPTENSVYNIYDIEGVRILNKIAFEVQCIKLL